MPTVVLLGTLDTKGAEYDYVRGLLRQLGCDVVTIDAGVRGQDRYAADIGPGAVAAAAGADLAALAEAGDRGAALSAMSVGATRIVTRLAEDGHLDAILALGGSGAAALAAPAMRALPIGVPKLIVSTMTAGDVRPYVGESDIAMLYPVVDIAGINRISSRVLANAAAAAAGMAGAGRLVPERAGRPLIGATMFGVTTPGVSAARERLEVLGYEVLVFHATGAGGRAMEGLVRAGFLAGVLDMTTTELADELVGGILSAGPDRLEAAAAAGLPQVVSLGALDMVNFGPRDTVPARFADRLLHRHNDAVTLMRTTREECRELGAIIARKLRRAPGSVAVFIPRRGFSMIDVAGQPFFDPEADAALVETLVAEAGPAVEIQDWDTDINDPAFATAMANRLDELVKAAAATRPAGVPA